MSLKKRELAKLKDKIMAEKERILNSFAVGNENKFHLNKEEISDEVDKAALDYERAQMLRFRNRDAFYAKKLDKALDKISNEEYGACEDCDCSIKFERLYARPTAELCINCKDEAEREENGNYIGRQSKSLEKRVELTAGV